MSKNQMGPDEIFRLVASIIEVAIENQNAAKRVMTDASEVLKNLNSATYQLPNAVATKVERTLHNEVAAAATTLVEKFNEANVHADTASAAYIKASRHVIWKIALIALAITGICVTAIALLANHLSPSYAELQQLRSERDSLANQISWINQQSRVDYIPCKIGATMRVCAKIEDREGKISTVYQLLARKN